MISKTNESTEMNDEATNYNKSKNLNILTLDLLNALAIEECLNAIKIKMKWILFYAIRALLIDYLFIFQIHPLSF